MGNSSINMSFDNSRHLIITYIIIITYITKQPVYSIVQQDSCSLAGAYLSEQGLHEQDPEALGELLSHEGERVLLQGAAQHGPSPHHSKHDAPGLDDALHPAMVCGVEHPDDVGQRQRECRHHDPQGC